MDCLALGELKIPPSVYYTMTQYEFFCACKGHANAERIYWENMRWGFFRVHQSMVEKPLSLTDFWLLATDQPAVTEEITDDWIREQKQRQLKQYTNAGN